jgi:alpha-mannosidase
VNANRFGLEQAQPLVHVLCDKNPMANPVVSIDNDRVFVTALKSGNDGKSTILRMRSLSVNDEFIKLTWPARQPSSVYLCERGEEPGKAEVSKGVSVPAMGMTTLRIEW